MKKQKVEEVHKQRHDRKAGNPAEPLSWSDLSRRSTLGQAQQKKKTFETLLGRQIWKAVVGALASC